MSSDDKHLRPWGALRWLFPKLGKSQWALLGVVSVEDRCLASFQELRPANARLLAIYDPEPLNPEAFQHSIEKRQQQFQELGVSESSFAAVPLLANLDNVKAQVEEVLRFDNPNIVLDISTMPKRWFYAILKILLSDKRAQNVVVTYATPAAYGPTLAENPSPIVMLPGFAGEGGQEYNSIIIGIGFEPLGLTNLIKELRLKRIRLLFPFPPGPPGYHRNWMFVKQIEDMTRTQSIEPPDRQSVHMLDCPQIFDSLCEMTEGAEISSVLTPYGPKPMSLAMCLFALAAARARKRLVPVYYAQPKRYASDYSTGVRTVENIPDVNAYCVKLGGNAIYAL